MSADLTAKQSLFVDEYLVDLNATQAAIRAGYSEKTATVIGAENLSKPYIAAAVQARMKERAQRTEITQDRVLREYAKLAFMDPRKLFDENGNPVPVHELDDQTAACVAGLDVSEEKVEGVVVGYVKKIKLTDKKGALDSIARHLGMFNDKIDLTGTLAIQSITRKIVDPNKK